MTATYSKKKDRQNYYIVLNYTDDTGKQKRQWIPTDIPVKGNNITRIKNKAKEVLADYEQQKTIREEQQIDLSYNILFVEFLKLWLEASRHSLAPTTFDAYNLTLKSHLIPYFETKRLKVKDLTPAHIQQYIVFKLKNLSPNTVRKHLANLSKCLDNAVRQNIIAFNPVKRIDMPKKKKFTGAKHYNEQQIEQLFKHSKSDPLEMAIFLTVFYGLRRSEVLGLKWSAIDMVNNTITIQHTVVKVDKVIHMSDSTKNDSSYSVMPLPEFVKVRLMKLREEQEQYRRLQPKDYVDNGYLCTKVDGSLFKPDYITKHFKLLLNKSNMPVIRFHDLRHSSAGYLKYLGFDLKDIQTWLRHSDIQTTMNIYVSLDMDAKQGIANSLNEKFKNMGS